MTFEQAMILLGGIFILFIVIVVILGHPKPIQVLKDNQGRELFLIYTKAFGFTVLDNTGIKTVRITFKTYQEIEAYVNRKMNGWKDIHTELS